jgi:SAM-dependent methyltransferase
MGIQSNWYESFFHGIALDLWRKAVSPEQTQAEVDFLIKALACPAGSKILDIPCGNGRHSLELAKRGYEMTGVDIAEQFIEEARAASLEAGEEVDWTLGDMRHIKWEATFDGAFCFGNSFGYLEYSDMESFLGSLARSLKPGARFVLQTGIAAEAILPNLKQRTWYQVGDILFAIENHYRADESCLDTYYTFVREGKVETREGKHWVYTAGEIRRMFERVGLAVSEMYSSTDFEPFTLGAHYLYVVAQKQS